MKRLLLGLVLVALALPAGAEDNRLIDVRVAADGAGAVLEIVGTRPPSFTTARTDGSLVIDFDGAVWPAQAPAAPGVGPLLQLRFAGGERAARLTLELAQGAEAALVAAGNSLRVAIQPGIGGAPAVAAGGREDEADPVPVDEARIAAPEVPGRDERIAEVEAREEAARVAQAEQQARDEAARIAQAEQRAREEAARIAQAEQRAREEAARIALAEQQAREEAARIALAEQQAREEAARIAQAEQRAREEAARIAQAEQQAREEAERTVQVEQQAREEAERIAQAEQQAREEAERTVQVEQQAREEAERIAQAEQQAREEAARIAQVEQQAREEAARIALVEQQAREEAARRAQAEQQAREEAARIARAEQEEAARIARAERKARDEAQRTTLAASARPVPLPVASVPPPQRPAAAPTATQELTYLGFKPTAAGARVVLRTAARPVWRFEQAPGRLVLILDRARIPLANNRRSIDASFFGTAVGLIRPVEDARRGEVRVEIALRSADPHFEISVAGRELLVDFTR